MPETYRTTFHIRNIATRHATKIFFGIRVSQTRALDDRCKSLPETRSCGATVGLDNITGTHRSFAAGTDPQINTHRSSCNRHGSIAMSLTTEMIEKGIDAWSHVHSRWLASRMICGNRYGMCCTNYMLHSSVAYYRWVTHAARGRRSGLWRRNVTLPRSYQAEVLICGTTRLVISTVPVAESRHSNSLWAGRFVDRIPSRPALGTTQRSIQGVPRHSPA